jgi:cell division protein FtsB
VLDLKHGDQAVEARARTELGLIKSGETFYQVVEPPAGVATVLPPATPTSAAQAGQP